MVFTGPSSILRAAAAGILLGFLAGCGDPEVRLEEDLRSAETLLEEGRTDEALESLNRLNEENPGRAEILRAMARAYEESGEEFFAGLYFERAARADPGSKDLLFRAARLFEAAGDRGRAISTVEEYLESYPDDGEAWRFSAGLLREERRFQAALSAHLRAERLDGPSRNPEYAAEMGDLYLKAGNPAQAEAYFETAIEKEQADRLPALLGLLGIHYHAGDFARAEEILARLDEEYPGAVEASVHAAARERIKLWRVAHDAIEEEIARLEEAAASPEDPAGEPPPGEEAPGAADAQTGPSADEGSEATVAAAEEDPGAEPAPSPGGKGAVAGESPAEKPPPPPPPAPPPPPPEPPPPTLAEQAAAAGDEGDWERAVELYWDAVGEAPEDAGLWAGLSRAYLRAGQPEDAEIAILEALRREPDDLQFTLTYLDVVQTSRSRKRFLEELERAYERIPNSPDIVLSLARAYGQPGGNPANAAYFYREFLEMAPTHPEATAARRELNALP